MSEEELDPVEWELVRADIAMEKARTEGERRLVEMAKVPGADQRQIRSACCVIGKDGARCKTWSFPDRGGTHRPVVGRPDP